MTIKKHISNMKVRIPFVQAERPSFKEDESGIAAMEFAIIAPIIIGVYLGLAELSMVLDIKRSISHSASVAADLATQVTKLEEADTADMISASLQVANISDTASYVLHMESFERDASGNVVSLGEVYYNEGGKSALPDVDVASLNTDMLDQNSGLVVARVAFKYTPMGFKKTTPGREGDAILGSSISLNETFLLKPRRSAVVEVGDAAGTKISCTGSTSNMKCSAS